MGPLMPQFCGAYDGWHRPFDGAPKIEIEKLLKAERPAGHMFVPLDDDGQPVTDDMTVGCIVILPADQPTCLPHSVIGRVVAAMDRRERVYIMAATTEDAEAAFQCFVGLAGGGRT